MTNVIRKECPMLFDIGVVAMLFWLQMCWDVNKNSKLRTSSATAWGRVDALW